MANWGDFCTFCGMPQQGEFPRRCANGHYTYASPVMVGVALQGVKMDSDVINSDIGLLVVRRNINPYKGELALPGGFVDQNETALHAALRELWEETSVSAQFAEPFNEEIGDSHNEADPRAHAVHFYRTPNIDYDDLSLNYENAEVQELEILLLSPDRQNLIDSKGNQVTLCFTTHHDAALAYLQNY